jgi:CDP-glycerol glycerophosphotransferase
MAGVPLISVVVPVYNVEAYLGECLDSIASQSVRDLEVIVVDDGSTDGSAAIAREWAARDPRFQVITQANGGLSAARNTGLDAARGELLSFVDSDDLLAPGAYERLHGALERTGSDFATGNVHRLTSDGVWQAQFLEKAFARTRLATHITRFPELLADRTAWNKLWRRSFWDAHGWRFPEGAVHEDIPITLPAHFLARSVDVISKPVYLYRMRDDGELSITQRRLEPRVFLDRLSAVRQVSEFLRREGPPGSLRLYQESVVAHDLRYHLDILDSAGEEYRETFLEQANAFLDEAEDGILEPLPEIERRKWRLVRERRLPELFDLLAAQRRGTLRVRLQRRVPVRYRRRVRRAMSVLRAS